MIKEILEKIIISIYINLRNKYSFKSRIITNNKIILSKNDYLSIDKTFIREIYYNKNNDKIMLKYKTKPSNNKSILFLAGFNDYIFYYHITEKLLDLGYDIYCLVLRNYSEVIEEDLKEFICYIDDKNHYMEDIDLLIENIENKNKNYQKMYICGHSTGGLISTYYCHKGIYKNKINGLILNSPFLDFNDNLLTEIFIKVIAFLFGNLFPRLKLREFRNSDELSQVDINYYRDVINRVYYDEKYHGFLTAIYLGWIKVCLEYQNFIKKNKLEIPIMVLYSNNTLPTDTISAEILKTGDIVLDTKEIEKYSKLLSNDVELFEIKNGIHNIFLSESDVVDKAFSYTKVWLNEN